MKLTEELVQQIAEADIETLWEHFNLMDNEEDFPSDKDYEMFKMLRDLVWYGFNIRFSIFDIWEDRVTIRGNYVRVTDPDTLKRMEYKLEDYRKEKLKRTVEMRKYIYQNSISQSPLVGR